MTQRQKTMRRYFTILTRGFQLRYLAYNIGFLLVGALMVWWEMSFAFRKVLADAGISTPYVQSAFAAITHIVILKVIVGLVLAALLALLLSHFVAGPVYRLEQCLRRVRGGETGVRMRLRRWDELKNLSQTFNDMARAVDERRAPPAR